MSRPYHILFAGGITPSHLYPGLAVASHVAERIPDAVITFVGGRRSQERHMVRAAGFRFANMPAHPAPQQPVRFVAQNVAGYWAARWFLGEQKVSLVVGLGGPASGAAARAAVSRGVPLMLLEQHVVPGPVTRWLARSADVVCSGFSQTARYLPSAVPLVVTGNPARPAFERLYRERHLRVAGKVKARVQCSDLGARLRLDPSHSVTTSHPQQVTSREKRLIVVGGAGGARSLNESMPFALARLRERLADWQIVHQTGEGQLQETAARYREVGLEALVVAYIDEMASVMFDSDLVVCRSAGTTLAELALAGVPAVLVPYPPAMDYQMPNAEVLATAGAAKIIDETELSGPLEDALVEELFPLLAEASRRAQMAAAMHRFARPEAAANITDEIGRILCDTSGRLAA